MAGVEVAIGIATERMMKKLLKSPTNENEKEPYGAGKAKSLLLAFTFDSVALLML